MKYLITIFFVLSSCYSKDVINNIKSEKLELLRVVYLEENTEVVMSEIFAAAIDRESRRILVTSGLNQLLVMYDLNTGKVIKHINADLSLSDSIKHSNRKPLAHPFNELLKNPIKYLSIEECASYGIQDLRMIRNQFMVPYFTSDNSIMALALVYLPALLEKDLKTAYNTPLIVHLDSMLNITRTIFPENTFYYNTLAYSFLFVEETNNYILMTETGIRYKYLKTKDSLSVLSVYNSDGNFIEPLLFLEDKIADVSRIMDNNLLGFLYLYNPKTTVLNNNYYSIYPYSSIIYDLLNKTQIQLKELPFDYSKQFMSLNNIDSDLEVNNYINENFPYSIYELLNDGRNFLVCVQNLMTNDFIIQKYDTNGNHISNWNLSVSEGDNINNFLYDKINNELLVFVKNETGWRIDVWKE